MPKYTFTYQWSAKDHPRVVNILTRELLNRGFMRLFKWFAIVLFVLALAFLVAALLGGRYSEAISSSPWVLIFFLWLLFLFYWTGPLQAWTFRRSDPNVGHPFVVNLDDDGYLVDLKTTRTELKWSGVYKILETPDLFMVYYSPKCAHYLPKRAVPADAIPALGDWLRGRLPPTAPYVVRQ